MSSTKSYASGISSTPKKRPTRRVAGPKGNSVIASAVKYSARGPEKKGKSA